MEDSPPGLLGRQTGISDEEAIITRMSTQANPGDAAVLGPDSILNRFRLDGRVAVVTGASSGLGVAIARGLASAGADVVIGARRIDRLAKTRDTISELGRECVSVAVDVTNREDCFKLADTAWNRFGRLDILVNNAGVGGDYHLATDDPPEHWLSVIDVNLNGSYWMAQACGRFLAESGSVINLSSVMAVTTAKMPAAAYSASKSGILGLTRDLAAQWGSRGVRVNAILPGVFPTEATANYSENYKRAIIDARVPLGRLGDPEEVAALVVFLASPASAYITGASIPIDGGVLLM